MPSSGVQLKDNSFTITEETGEIVCFNPLEPLRDFRVLCILLFDGSLTLSDLYGLHNLRLRFLDFCKYPRVKAYHETSGPTPPSSARGDLGLMI